MTEQTQLSLNDAIKANNLDRVEELLEYGADVHANDDEALREACLNHYFEVARLLLKYGADVHVYDNEPLRIACQFQDLEVNPDFPLNMSLMFTYGMMNLFGMLVNLVVMK